MSKLTLKKNEDKRIRLGHPWVFSNEIARFEGNPVNGDIIAIFDSGNRILGHAFYNKNSLIAARILRDYTGDFYQWSKEKILSAHDLRKTFYPQRDSFRLVFSESDYLPGLIIDKYNDTFVLQLYCFGMQMQVEIIVRILKEELNAQNIFAMSDPYFRKLEGLPEDDETFMGSTCEEIIDDGMLKYKVNFARGQKTGFYFDQCDNREFVERIVKGKNVLDAFCYSGGFGMHAALAGASSVTFVDSVVNGAKENYKLNNLKAPAEFIKSDVFDYLQQNPPLRREGGDVIILDPPAFAKSKKSVPSALKGYIKLNKLALQLIPSGGFLVTSSCSHHISREDFLSALNTAAAKAGKSIQLLHFSGASLDHPVLPAMPETSYLKFVVLRVDS
jgi:23S rRNA (cytosine1962-C5)-methyltransferase